MRDSIAADSIGIIKKQKMEYLLTMDSNIVAKRNRWIEEYVPLTATDTFDVDGYHLPQSIFRRGDEPVIYSGGLQTDASVWCTNDTLGETIFVELYTDHFRNRLFHFKNDDIPTHLLEQMYIAKVVRHVSSKAAVDQKERALPGFIKQAFRVDSYTFTSIKGFQLGDPSEKALLIYGQPDTTYYSDGAACWSWSFAGEHYSQSWKNYKNKPIARDSWGYDVYMYFRDEKLIGMVLHNDIP